MKLAITVNGQTQVIQLGTLSAAVNQQITQAVAACAAYVAELPSLVVQQVATFASLPASPVGLYLVLADETKNGNPTIYFFTATSRYWIAMVQDA